MAVSQTSCEPMFINGERTEGSSGKRIPVYDPSTEEVIAEIPDASAVDIDAAVAAAAFGAFFNQGQICMSTERIIVDESVADEFVAKLSAKAATLGDRSRMASTSPSSPCRLLRTRCSTSCARRRLESANFL